MFSISKLLNLKTSSFTVCILRSMASQALHRSAVPFQSQPHSIPIPIHFAHGDPSSAPSDWRTFGIPTPSTAICIWARARWRSVLWRRLQRWRCVWRPKQFRSRWWLWRWWSSGKRIEFISRRFWWKISEFWADFEVRIGADIWNLADWVDAVGPYLRIWPLVISTHFWDEETP